MWAAFSCKEDPILWAPESESQVMTDYINSKPEEFSEISKVLEFTNLNSLLSTRGPFTFFLPTDEAMEAFYQENGVTSFDQFTDTLLVFQLLYNHLINNSISSGDVGLGALRDTNALGDFLVTEFQGADIILNKTAKIIDRDVRVSNGFIHVIDKVIKPVTISVYDQIAEISSFSLFAEGLEITGLKDTLSLIEFPYGDKMARTRFTVFAVADTTFNRFGITTIDELVAYFTDSPDSVSYLENDFYRYMEYHCLGGTYYMSDLETSLYPILSYDNNILIDVVEDFKINLNKTTEEYIGFYFEQSNVPTKNGALHTINDLMPVITPDPTIITWEVTDHFDLQQGDYFGKYYRKWSDGQNTFENIKWYGDFLQYYFKDHDTGPLLNDDCLQMLGYWWIEVTTPKIMKGKYKIGGNIWRNNASYEVYVDGVKSTLVQSSDIPDLGTFEWEKTETHTIKLVSVSYGSLFWDTLTFTPVD